MTQVDFYFNAPDRSMYACRLLRKAAGQGNRIGVWCDDQTMESLNQSLWQLNATDFVTHCLSHDEPTRVERSSVVIGSDWSALGRLQNMRVFLNLNHSVPPDLNPDLRILEVVGPEEVDKSSARERWKYYSQAGFQINRHDLASLKVL